MDMSTPAEIVIGVDSHRHIHAALALNGLGVRLGTTTIPVSSKGDHDLEAWACSFGRVRAIGIEGTGSYRAGLARSLLTREHTVVEVSARTGSCVISMGRATRSMPRVPAVPFWPGR